MAVMDEFRKEREEALRNSTLKEKISYYWYYYKWHAFIIGFAFVSVVSIIYNAITAKDIVLYAIFPNSTTLAEDNGAAYVQTFADHIQLDTDKYEIYIDRSLYLSDLSSYNEDTYAAVQKIATYVAAGEIDLMISDPDIFNYYMYLDYLADLRNILTEEQLARYADRLYYMDYTIYEEKQAAVDANGVYTIVYPDPTKPEEMANPIPVGIVMDDADPAFFETYKFVGKASPVISVIANTEQFENVQSYIDYIMLGLPE